MAGQTPHQDDHGPSGRRPDRPDHPEPGAAHAPDSELAPAPAPGNDDIWDLDHLVLDEEFIREADATEPSARARMLAARWRRERPEPQPWRSDEPPAGWFFSKGRRRRWRRG